MQHIACINDQMISILKETQHIEFKPAFNEDVIESRSNHNRQCTKYTEVAISDGSNTRNCTNTN